MSVSMNLATPGTSYKRNYTIFIFLLLAYFTQHNVFKVYPCTSHVSICQNYLPFSAWIIFHLCIYYILFLYSPIDGHLNSFCLLDTVNAAAWTLWIILYRNVFCCCSFPKSCSKLCDPTGCSRPGFPVLHHLRVCSNSSPLIRWCHPIT